MVVYPLAFTLLLRLWRFTLVFELNVDMAAVLQEAPIWGSPAAGVAEFAHMPPIFLGPSTDWFLDPRFHQKSDITP